MAEQPTSIPPDSGPKRPVVTIFVVFTLVALAAVAYVLAQDQFTLERLVRSEQDFRTYERTQPMVTYAVAFLIYVVVTALSLPFATILSLIYGWLFGFARGVILVSLASTAGATCSFLLSRYVVGHVVQRRFEAQLRGFNAALAREGAFYLFTLRLLPYVPFLVVNLVMGLTKMRARTFWWVSQLGMLPGTLVYLSAGSSIKSLSALSREGLGAILTPQFLVAFTLLGVFPLIVKRVAVRFVSAAKPKDAAGSTQ